MCSMDRDIKSTAAETHLHLTVPVQVVPVNETRRGHHVIGESFVLRPWIGLSDDDEFTISTDVVLTIGDLKKEVRQQYITYVNQSKESRKSYLDQEERADAAVKLLREVNDGNVRIIHLEEELPGEFYNDENEEGR